MRVNTRQLPVDSAAPARLITRLDRAEVSGCGPGQPTAAKPEGLRTHAILLTACGLARMQTRRPSR